MIKIDRRSAIGGFFLTTFFGSLLYVTAMGYFPLPGNFKVPVSQSPDIKGITRADMLASIREKLDRLISHEKGIEDIRLGLQSFDWIDAVRVRKVWPNTLEVEVREKVPIAKWDEAVYIDRDGLLFTSPFPVASDMVKLHGPEGSEKVVMWHYKQLNQVLSLTGNSIDILRQDPRGAWTFEIDNIVVKLGNEDMLQRMKRFMRVIKSIRASGGEIVSIDTRYPNGVAVAWKQDVCEFDCIAGRQRSDGSGSL